jgi:hypothetical protein
MITKKMLKASRFHNVVCLMRSAGHRATTYSRRIKDAILDAAEAVGVTAEAITATSRTLWQRFAAFVRRLFGMPVTAS